ncbi:MAG: hypothetical protein OYH77_08850 [Pseudomonadota bacterium]|nr:hypothetical protein [Pseudomonadota bacterium]
MKICLYLSCMTVALAAVFGCIRRTDSSVASMPVRPKMLVPLENFYTNNETKLKNLHDASKVSDAEVAEIKKFLHKTLKEIITALPDKIEHRDTRISYVSEERILSYHSAYGLCESVDRSKCFRLEIQFSTYYSSSIKVWQLPANKDLASISQAYSESKLPTLLDALRSMFPHKLGYDELNIRYYGKDDDKTLYVLAGAASTDNRRELHIKVKDGSIDNTSNALFPHIIWPRDVMLLDDESEAGGEEPHPSPDLERIPEG